MYNPFSVGVKQTGVYVHVTGVSFYNLAKDIEKFYSTALVTKYMIRRESWDTIKVHNFYLVELHFLLGELLKLKTLRSRRRSLNELRQLLETDTWIKDTVTPSGKPFDFKRLDAFTKSPFPKQREFLEQYPLITKSYHLKGILLDSVPGSGKAMPKSTKVKVPGGWKALGAIQVGDQVMTPSGRVSDVSGVHDQGVTDVYRFYFEDGRWADSHPEHLWHVDEVSVVDGEVVISPDNVTTTQDILDHFQDYEYQIPLVSKIDGLLSGEGFASIEVAEELLLSSIAIDDPVLELPYSERFNIAKAMLGRSGCQISAGSVAFVTSNTMAASNFQALIWSLGGIAEKTAIVDVGYRVDVYHGEIEELVADLVGPGLKLEELLDLDMYKNLRLKIVGVEKRDREETLCITVDDPDHLFVVDDYIVTHNTFTSLMWSHLLGNGKTIIICPLNIVDSVWMTQIKEHFKVTPRIWNSKTGLPLTDAYDYYIVHYDALVGPRFAYLREWMKTTVKADKQKFKLIVDESQNFNEISAKQTQNLIELADLQLFADALPVSGTPFKALGSEIYPMLCIFDLHFDSIAREFFKASYGRNRPSLMGMLSHRIGRSKFTIPELLGLGDPPPIEIVKVQVPNSDKYTLDSIKLEMQVYIQERFAFYEEHMPQYVTFFNEILQDYEYDNQKNPKELEDLAKYRKIVQRFRTQGYSSFTDAQDSMFCKRVEEDIESRLRGKDLSDFRNVKSAVKYLGLKLRGEALGNVLGRARINAIKETIEHANLEHYIDDVEKKTVIFTSYVDVLKLCDEYLTKKGYTGITVYGENSKDRDAAIKRFAEDPRINPLTAVYDSLKEGYPLLMANQELMLNAPWRDFELKQVQARIWRTGQTSPCFFRMFDMDTGDKVNITTRSINVMEWSKEQVDALLGRAEGHIMLADVTGEEMFDMSDEAFTQPLTRSNSVLDLFN
jgi:hypothetical protein